MYELRQLTRRYRQGPRLIAAVDGIDLTIQDGEFLVIEGRSGSGKTTLLQLLGGLDRPSSGQLFFDGQELASMPDQRLTDLRLRAFGFIFQQFNLIPTLTAMENVQAALAPAGVKGNAMRTRALELLGEVGLADRAHHLPSQLSGGEQQRVAIARALANHPRVILADEPTGNLDSKTGDEIITVLRNLWQQHGQSVILVTHDRTVAASAPRVLSMQDGRLLDNPPADVLPGLAAR